MTIAQDQWQNMVTDLRTASIMVDQGTKKQVLVNLPISDGNRDRSYDTFERVRDKFKLMYPNSIKSYTQPSEVLLMQLRDEGAAIAFQKMAYKHGLEASILGK